MYGIYQNVWLPRDKHSVLAVIVLVVNLKKEEV